MDNIKLLVMDVDGTLTDGKIYMGQDGEIAKAFNIKDGCGILLELPRNGIVPVIITARESAILENRCAELGIKEVHQGIKNKEAKLQEIADMYNIGLDSVAYIGDDLPDIPCMEAVKKAGGLIFCPADAISDIKSIADYVSGLSAGNGAIRDIINYIVASSEKMGNQNVINEVIDWIRLKDFSNIEKESFELENGVTCSIQEYYTKPESECLIESHRKHIDVQYIIEGCELFKTYSTTCLPSAGEYIEDKDVEYWIKGIEETQSYLVPESIIVIQNEQPHKGAISIRESTRVKKLVCKVPVS